MNPLGRRLQILNLAGVVILVLLCVAQWHRDRALNLDLLRLEKTRQDQAAQMARRTRDFQGLNDDLAQLKASLTEEHQSRTGAEKDLAAADRANHLLTLERDQFKAGLTNWMAAVGTRDDRLKEANNRINALSADLNLSILKYNTLATNQNTLILKFNTLATNYGAALEELYELRARLARTGTGAARPTPKP